MSQPIADLSYRDYDGPHLPVQACWRPIMRFALAKAFRNKWYWIMMVLASWFYFAIIAVLNFVERFMVAQDPRALTNVLRVFGDLNDLPVLGFTFAQLPIMIITIMLGSGIIAHDRRSNALLVYLSKPVTAWNYVLGKFLGLFIPVLAAMAGPGLLFLFISLLSYQRYGFAATPEPFLKMSVVYVVAALFYSSLMLGFGAITKQGRIAGSAYAGLYLVTGFFTVLTYQTWQGTLDESAQVRSTLLSRTTYASVDGIMNGFAKSIMETSAPGLGDNQPGTAQISVPFPPLWLPSIVVVFAVGLSLWLLWRSVKAVEVVR